MKETGDEEIRFCFIMLTDVVAVDIVKWLIGFNDISRLACLRRVIMARNHCTTRTCWCSTRITISSSDRQKKKTQVTINKWTHLKFNTRYIIIEVKVARAFTADK